MIDKKQKKKYNDNVVVINKDDRTIYKLYRNNVLVYIGVMMNEFAQRLGTSGNV